MGTSKLFWLTFLESFDSGENIKVKNKFLQNFSGLIFSVILTDIFENFQRNILGPEIRFHSFTDWFSNISSELFFHRFKITNFNIN